MCLSPSFAVLGDCDNRMESKTQTLGSGVPDPPHGCDAYVGARSTENAATLGTLKISPETHAPFASAIAIFSNPDGVLTLALTV